MGEQPHKQKVATLRKVQIFFIFLLLVTGLSWMMTGPATNPEQRHFRMAIGIAESIGLLVTTVLVMRKRS